MDSQLFLYAAGGLVAGIVIFVKGIQWYGQKRMIDDTPTSKIRSIAMGLVEINGKVAADAKRILSSPFSGKDCVYYKYMVEEYRSSNKPAMLPTVVIGENPNAMPSAGGGWVAIATQEERANFYLSDATGKVLVDPEGAKIDVPADYEFSSGFGNDPPQKVMDFLSGRGISHDGLLGVNKQMRFREYVISPGDGLYIMGTAGANPLAKKGSAMDHTEGLMIQKGENEKMYLISSGSEKDVVGRLKWKVYGGLGGGTALIAGCLAVMFLYTGFL
jgi:hypothetical protein